MAGGDVGSEGVGGRSCRIEATEAERAVDTRQNSLGGHALLGAVGLTILPQDHSRTNLPLGEVILKRHIRVIQKRKNELGQKKLARWPRFFRGVELIEIERRKHLNRWSILWFSFLTAVCGERNGTKLTDSPNLGERLRRARR